MDTTFLNIVVRIIEYFAIQTTLSQKCMGCFNCQIINFYYLYYMLLFNFLFSIYLYINIKRNIHVVETKSMDFSDFPILNKLKKL